MRHRTHRLRRLAAAVAIGVGTMGGSLVALSSVAGAATVTTATISASSKALGTWVGTTQSAGTIVIKLPAAGTFNTKTITLTATNTPATGTVVFSTAKVTSTGAIVTHTPGGVGTAALTVHVITKTTGNAATITVHTVRYTTNAALDTAKKVVVTPTSAGVTFTPTSVSNAAYPASTTKPYAAILANDTTRPVPPIGEGTTGRKVGSWTLTLAAGTTKPATRGVQAGEHLQITVEPHGGTAHCATTNAVAFSGKPVVSVTKLGTKHVSGTVKVTVGALTGNNGCTGFFAPNVLTINFTNTVHFANATGRIVINITTVKYSVASGAKGMTTNGTVTVKARLLTSTTKLVNTTTVTDATTTKLNNVGIPDSFRNITNNAVTSTNAVVSHAYVTVTPVKTIPVKSVDQAIGTIKVVESVAGSVPSGYVCVTLSHSTRTKAPGWKNTTTLTSYTVFTTGGFWFNGAGKPTVKVVGGNGSASTAAFATTFTRTHATVSFKVTKSTSASTFVLSGLAVDNYNATGTLMPLVTAYYTTTATCSSGPTATFDPTDNVAVLLVTGTPPATQIYGATSDATAVAELESVYGGPGFTGTCPTTLGGHHPVLLARDTFYSDALASQYLASYLNTGTLLTHPNSLSTVTKSALAFEGITTVYVIGGPLAITTAVSNAIKALPVYHCGGRKVTVTTGTGVPKTMKVIRVTGPTEYATAQAIGTRVPKATVGTIFAQNAYATAANFNDTTGTASAKASSSGALKTAILATGSTFQDAMSASAFSYSTHLPIVLTTPGSLSSQAMNELTSLNVQQVVVMGGPLAVSNKVVTQVEALTVTGGSRNISVLRVAGKTYTETATMLAKFELGTTNGGIDWDQASSGPCKAATNTGTTMRTLVARGTYFTDGLTGAVLEACGVTPFSHFFHSSKRMPLLLTMNPSTVGAPLTAYLKAAGLAPAAGGTGVTSTGTEHLRYLTIIGGPFAVNPSTIAAMLTDLKS